MTSAGVARAASVLLLVTLTSAWQLGPAGSACAWQRRAHVSGSPWPSQSQSAGVQNLICSAAKSAKKRKKTGPMSKGGVAGVETEVQRLKSAPFMREIEEAGMLCDKISLATFGELRGVMAKTAIKSGETLIAYPRAAAMDLAAQGSVCPCPELIDAKFWNSAPWYLQLGLWLVAEEAKGESSKWASYIALLPRTLSTPVHWSSSQLNELHYPAVVLSVREQREHFSTLVASAQQHLAPGASSEPLDRLEWAMEMVLSRALDSAEMPRGDEGLLARIGSMVGLGGSRVASTKAMVPMLDFINHDSSAQPRFCYDARTGSFAVRAERSYRKGDQVYLSYGAKSNDDLLGM